MIFALTTDNSDNNKVDVNENPCCNGTNIFHRGKFCLNELDEIKKLPLDCENHEIIIFDPEVDETKNFTIDKDRNLHLFFSFLDKDKHVIPPNK